MHSQIMQFNSIAQTLPPVKFFAFPFIFKEIDNNFLQILL